VDLSVVFYDSNALSFDESTAEEVATTMTAFRNFSEHLEGMRGTETYCI
jgi:hypothetical protein